MRGADGTHVTTSDYAPQPQYTELLHFCLKRVVELGASDLHLRQNEPPFMRRNSRLQPIPDTRPLLLEELQGMIGELTAAGPHRRDEFERDGEADLSYELPGVARYRVNVFRERGNIALTLRVIPSEVPQLDNIGVPPVIRDLSLSGHGLILVTGATGSGKTTTLAAMIDHRNRETQNHILTIEDPIEIVHPNHQSIISQREVGTDTGDFQQALRRALRQDPDVILIGEIRDEETMRTALAAAETGHLVLATLHTINAQETIARVLDLFPSEAESQARAMLAGALKGIVSQRLARTLDDKRVPVVEVMVNTSRIADCITNPDETAKIGEAMEAGEYYGMQTFDQALIKLIMAGRISEDEALHHCTSAQNFKLTLQSAQATAKMHADQAAALAAQQAAMQRPAQAAPGAAPGVPGVPGVPAAPAAPGAAPVAAPPSAAAHVPVPGGLPSPGAVSAPPHAVPVPPPPSSAPVPAAPVPQHAA